MFQVRIHGRGGQGVVTAAEILSVAAFEKVATRRRFPASDRSDGRAGRLLLPHRRPPDPDPRAGDGAGRADHPGRHPASTRSISSPGSPPDGYVLINTSRTFDELGLGALVPPLPADHLATCPATEIALEHLGRPCRTPLCSAGSPRSTGEISLDARRAAIRQRFPGAVGEAQCRRRHGRVSVDSWRARNEARRACARLRDPGRWPRRWPRAGPRWSAPIRSRRRPTSSRRSAPW